MTQQTFGSLLKNYRRNSIDPDFGGALTQGRFVVLMEEVDDRIYYDASMVTRWENNSRLGSFKERFVSLSLIHVLYRCANAKGLTNLILANEMLAALGVRDLTTEEAARIGFKNELDDTGTVNLSQQGEGPYEDAGIAFEAPGLNLSRWFSQWLKSLRLRLIQSPQMVYAMGPDDEVKLRLLLAKERERRPPALPDNISLDNVVLIARSKSTGKEYEVDLGQIVKQIALTTDVVENAKSPTYLSALSHREEEIFEFVAGDGCHLKNKEIATHFQVSTATIRKHLRNIYQKLGVPSHKAALVRYKSGTG